MSPHTDNPAVSTHRYFKTESHTWRTRGDECERLHPAKWGDAYGVTLKDLESDVSRGFAIETDATGQPLGAGVEEKAYPEPPRFKVVGQLKDFPKGEKVHGIVYDPKEPEQGWTIVGDWLAGCDDETDQWWVAVSDTEHPQPAGAREWERVLRMHHEWHLAQTEEDAHGIVGADAYAESELCEVTLKALRGVREVAGASGWRPIESAPRDGTRVLLWIEHANAKHVPDPATGGWAAACIGHWAEHNGGGWVWHGMAGTALTWQPLPAVPARDQDSTQS